SRRLRLGGRGRARRIERSLASGPVTGRWLKNEGPLDASLIPERPDELTVFRPLATKAFGKPNVVLHSFSWDRQAAGRVRATWTMGDVIYTGVADATANAAQFFSLHSPRNPLKSPESGKETE